VSRPRRLVLPGLAATLLANAWALETIAATVAAFALLGAGLRREPSLRRLGTVTIAARAVFVALTLVAGATFVAEGFDVDKGLGQRLGQVVLGAWLAVLAVGTGRVRRARRPWPAG
jgi:O-antigen ligase